MRDKNNGIMMQYFEWYLPEDGTLWKKVAAEAQNLAKAEITGVWLPPAYKGQAGKSDVGYGVYDLYDLGEFDQKGSVCTKYGTKDEYLGAIESLHQENIQVYADVVLNHKMGADEMEEVNAIEDNSSNRWQTVSGEENIEAWTKFTFPGRGGKYSNFTWNHTHFDGVDWDQRNQRTAIYNFVGTPWDNEVDGENANYDYLMGADICFANQEVRDELARWGQWYLQETGVDGFRLDAVKHIPFTYYKDWLGKLRQDNKRELFTVGEYWSPEVKRLTHYLQICERCMSLFDVPLHFNFFKACNSGGNYDMSKILDGTLLQADPGKAVTFVENHDTQAGQALQTVIADWFKPLAYAIILLRQQGYPCIFYGDYYGVPTHNVPSFQSVLDAMCEVRQTAVFGQMHDYFDHNDIVGWTLEGDENHPDSGAAVLLSDGPGGTKKMYVGSQHKGQIWADKLHVPQNRQGEPKTVIIDEEGFGNFIVDGGSVSAYVLQK